MRAVARNRKLAANGSSPSAPIRRAAVAFSLYASPNRCRIHSASTMTPTTRGISSRYRCTASRRTCGPSAARVWTDSTVRDAAMLMGTSVSDMTMVQVIAK